MSKYVVGDIHGCFKTFQALLKKIDLDGGKLQDVVLAGDLVDRGPDSCSVIQFVMDNKIDCVLGNHEQMMIDAHDHTEHYPGAWESNGGKNTLDSYPDGLRFPSVFGHHVKFIKSLPLFLEYPHIKNAEGRHLVVSHSCIGKVWDWSKERREEQADTFKQIILWDRYSLEDAPGIYNVFGHTPIPTPRIKSFYANVDTGCVFNRVEFNKLTALKFPEMEIIQQENIEDVGE